MAAGTERRATYRVQLHAGFGFDAAASLSDYLTDLGVSHLYCSPSLQAAPRSMHGYDVVDPARISDELGGAAAFGRMSSAVRSSGLTGVLLDIVPNHMAAHRANPWWWDVLEDGGRSPFAPYFDVDWGGTLNPHMQGRVLLPVLGDHVGRAVERGELRVERRGDGRIVLCYHDQSAPLSPQTVAALLHAAARASESAVLGAAARAAEALAGQGDSDPLVRRAERAAVWDEVRRACEDDDAAAAAVDAQIETLLEARSEFDRLLRAQAHRVARWRVALREVNYRRFFDITSLIGLRVEDERVFAATHALVLDLVARGDLDGVRVDHVDGLRLPASYLRRLRDAVGETAWIVVEKILGEGEALPHAWPVEGTTGYEFAVLSTRLLTDPRGEAPLTALVAELGGPTDVHAALRAAKLQVMGQTLEADVSRLASLLRRVCDARPRVRDFTLAELRDAVAELIAAMPVYRSYAAPGEALPAQDAQWVDLAVASVRRDRPDVDRELLDTIASLLLDETARNGDADATELVLRFQQVCAAVMAKGVEDTAFYRVFPLASLNEVGGGPQPFSASADDVHRHNREVQAHWPQTLLAATTHDTKRSEDVRARLSLLSEIPERWAETVRAWRGRNARHRRGGWPDGPTEYLLYQSLVGAWPIERERMQAYMEKAVREAKLHTSWIDPSPEYESALRGFVDALYDDAAFLRAVEDVTAPLVQPGRVNSLAATLLRFTSPGVPDIYQGCELWMHALVDPDNRRPVDYEARRALLLRAQEVSPAAAWADEADAASGLPKLLLIQRSLAARAHHPEAFGPAGDYLPLRVSGERADNVVAFARGATPAVVTVVPRLAFGVDGDWRDTTVFLPEGDWHSVLAGGTVRGDARVGEMLRDFPVALLTRVARA
ncbi:MAG TPA: malto-oligosyltrehalose synthase [Candidatus Dormibacteraeota bacterium]|nr:malto-oligosyltrehalose synthase [Candidatus Dormibacteraeota bacterium]